MAHFAAMAQGHYLTLPVGVVSSSKQSHQPVNTNLERQQCTCSWAILSGHFTSHRQFLQLFSCSAVSFSFLTDVEMVSEGKANVFVLLETCQIQIHLCGPALILQKKLRINMTLKASVFLHACHSIPPKRGTPLNKS